MICSALQIPYSVLYVKQKKNDNSTDEDNNFTCYDVISSYKQFHMKVYGIKLLINNTNLNKSLYRLNMDIFDDHLTFSNSFFF